MNNQNRRANVQTINRAFDIDELIEDDFEYLEHIKEDINLGDF